MKIKSGIAAFTIIEAIVGMAVTAIVLFLVFLIFTIASDRLYDFKAQNEDILNVNRLAYSLNKSIFDSEQMVLSDNILLFKSYTGNNTYYKLEKDFLTRTNENFIDTFNIAVKFRIDVLKSKSGKQVFECLTADIIKDGKKNQYRFYKKKYVSTQLNTYWDEY